jgi:DNA repair photolyase
LTEQPLKLVGIARLASEGKVLAEKRRVEYRTLPTRKWLNRCHSPRVPFTWTINPYRGCEYGCKYCYARFTHEFLERWDPVAFESEIYAKDWNRQSFLRELKQVKPGHVIGIGTATDPYQPSERKFGRTAGVLEALQALAGVSLYITTKSDLVSRDADLLRELSRHNDVRVTLTVTTVDRDFARLAEPFAPRPDLRLAAVRSLTSSGIRAGVISSPVLPLLSDSEESLRAVGSAAKAAGATHFGAGVLFLKPTVQRVFFPFLAEHFPQYLQRYESSYRSAAYLRGEYPDRIGQLIESIRREFGFGTREISYSPPVPAPGAQLKLF